MERCADRGPVGCGPPDDFNALVAGQPSGFSLFLLDKTSGHNGDKIQMTIGVAAANAQGEVFTIESALRNAPMERAPAEFLDWHGCESVSTRSFRVPSPGSGRNREPILESPSGARASQWDNERAFVWKRLANCG